MAQSIRVEINFEGATQLMKSPEVMADLEARAQRIAAAAGSGHMVTAYAGKTRARVSVITASDTARRRESTDRNLTRAIDAARG